MVLREGCPYVRQASEVHPGVPGAGCPPGDRDRSTGRPVARELGVHEGTLGRWVNADRRAREGYAPDPPGWHTSDQRSAAPRASGRTVASISSSTRSKYSSPPPRVSRLGANTAGCGDLRRRCRWRGDDHPRLPAQAVVCTLKGVGMDGCGRINFDQGNVIHTFVRR